MRKSISILFQHMHIDQWVRIEELNMQKPTSLNNNKKLTTKKNKPKNKINGEQKEFTIRMARKKVIDTDRPHNLLIKIRNEKGRYVTKARSDSDQNQVHQWVNKLKRKTYDKNKDKYNEQKRKKRQDKKARQ